MKGSASSPMPSAARAAAPMALYAGERIAGAFERTASRLVEMQSAEYLTSEHHAR